MLFLLAVFCILHENIFLAGILATILQIFPAEDVVITQDKISSIYTSRHFSSIAKLEIGLYSLFSC
jgi:hypothetical protein